LGVGVGPTVARVPNIERVTIAATPGASIASVASQPPRRIDRLALAAGRRGHL